MYWFVNVVLERVDHRGRCAFLNETLSSPERGATSAKRRPSSVGLGDLTNTRLFWIVIMAALSGTCLVLLTVAVAMLMRRVCCYVESHHRRRRRQLHHHRQQPQLQQRGPHQSRHHRTSSDCGCRQHASPMSQLPLADIELLDDLSRSARCDATEV